MVPYGTTGTPALGDVVEPFIPRVMMPCCWPITGRSRGAPIWRVARIRMESLEHGARILLAARTLGTVTLPDPEQTTSLQRLRGIARHGLTPPGY